MPRIRSIKPEVPEDETLGRVSRDARLTFILLWTRADDLGRFRAAPALLKGQLFPYDNATPKQVAGWVDELVEVGRVWLYEIGGQIYGEVVNWGKHQRIDNASKSLLPPSTHDGESLRLSASLGEPRRTAAAPPTPRRGSPLDRKGGDRKGGDPPVGDGEPSPGGEVAVLPTPAKVANDLTRRFWEDANPKPAVKFVALAKIVERFVEAGWPPTAIAEGLRRTRAFTISALEYTLRQHQPQAEPDGWASIRAALEGA